MPLKESMHPKVWSKSSQPLAALGATIHTCLKDVLGFIDYAFDVASPTSAQRRESLVSITVQGVLDFLTFMRLDVASRCSSLLGVVYP